MSRCATLRSAMMMFSIRPDSSISTSACGRSKSTDPRRRRRPLRIAEQLVHQLEQRQQRLRIAPRRWVAGRQNRVDVRVGHPLVAVDDPVVELHSDDVAVAGDLHQARLHQPIHVRLERAQARRQFRREHVDRALGEVDGGAPLVRLGVERAALLDVVRDVGDVHAQPVVAVGQPLERDGVVEVARVLAVDGHRRQRPEVGAAVDVAWPDRRAQRRGLGDRVLAVRRPAASACG